MKKFVCALALAGVFVATKSPAISLDDVQFWTGSGTNRAALVVEWNAPVTNNASTVPAPVTSKTMVWGYRFNGSPTATQMFNAIVAADKRLYAIETIDPSFGAGVDAIGYNLDGTGQYGVSDGSNTYHATNFVNGLLVGATLTRDAAVALDNHDLYWSGHYGPNWVQWTEDTYSGGFSNSPNRGTNQYFDQNTFTHGEWGFGNGLDYTPLFDGSWLGFSVAGAGFPTDTNSPDYQTNLTIAETDTQAPPAPDGTYTAYVYNSNDFAVSIASTSNVFTTSPYNDPNALIGRPTQKFLDHFGDHTAHRVKIVEAPYWTTPQGSNVITEISSNGQITVNLGRKIYDDPGNPYGVDFIVYGNSFYSATGFTGFINDKVDLDAAHLGNYGGHSTTVSVSQDGVNWYTYSNLTALFPQNAYRWDTTNHSWTDEEMNPTKPINPYLSSQSLNGLPVSSALDQFGGAAGGTGFDLKPSGLPWIQYVRVEPGVNTYTVIDAIAAVNPAVLGDALTIAPTNLSSGATNLTFRKQDGSSNSLICLNFSSLSDTARVSTIGLSDFSSYSPAFGNVSSAYQITVKPLTNTAPITFAANLSLRVGDNYSGNGSNLVVYQWLGTNWTPLPFAFDAANRQVLLTGVTNLSLFTVSQISAPQLAGAPPVGSGTGLHFAPMPGVQYTLQRSVDFVNWTNLTSIVASNSQPVTLQDFAPPADKAFYRLSSP